MKILGDCLLNVFMVYAPHSGKPDEEKESFGDKVFHLVSCIPQNKMVVFAGGVNGHIGSSNVGHGGTHFGFGRRFCVSFLYVAHWNCGIFVSNIIGL